MTTGKKPSSKRGTGGDLPQEFMAFARDVVTVLQNSPQLVFGWAFAVLFLVLVVAISGLGVLGTPYNFLVIVIGIIAILFLFVYTLRAAGSVAGPGLGRNTQTVKQLGERSFVVGESGDIHVGDVHVREDKRERFEPDTESIPEADKRASESNKGQVAQNVEQLGERSFVVGESGDIHVGDVHGREDSESVPRTDL